MASALSDDELRRKLQEMGEIVGPITRTTRKVWEKRLDKAMQEQKKNRSHTITRSNTLHLDHFSSDESEDALCTETSQNHRLRYRRRRIIGSDLPSNSSNQSDSNTKDNITFKLPLPGSPITITRTLNKSVYKSYTSPSGSISRLTRPSVRSVQKSDSILNSFDIDSSDSDVDPDRSRRCSRKETQPGKTVELESTVNTLKDEWSNSIRKEKFYNGNRKEVEAAAGLNHVSTKANGYASDENSLWNTFKTEDDSRISTNYSQWISMFLVIVTTLFFIIVGILYVGVKQKDLPSDQNYNTVYCEKQNGDGNDGPIEKDDFAQEIAWKLYTLLAETRGQFQCNERSTIPRLSNEDLKSQFGQHERYKERVDFEEIYQAALEMIAKDFQWGITMYDENNSIVTDIKHLHDIHALEAVIASKSLQCRLKQAFLQSSIELLCFLSVILTVIGTIFFIRRYKRKKALEEKRMYAVVENIIDILKQQNEKCQGSPDIEPVLAISHVCNMLIPPAERKLHQKLWDKAVKFLEENDSRVRVERQHIAGEDYKVWRWLQPSTPEIGGKYGKVWQGQAFGNTGKGINTLPFSPTPCLKIRNMFDPEVEYGDDWQVFITDAILEKCENNNNIVHIKVDISSNEGCVYLKCTNSESAGQAYRALHGWWFDRKLVTVKYLRLERYHERFPESKHCSTPLKPSNNMRLSLSAPFHSSALESS